MIETVVLEDPTYVPCQAARFETSRSSSKKYIPRPQENLLLYVTNWEMLLWAILIMYRLLRARVVT